jgi:hypothetical protein
MIVRPQPKAFETENIAEGKYRADTGVSASWFSKGGLEWDGQQLKLWDADGAAHILPPAPAGAIVRNIEVYLNRRGRPAVPSDTAGQRRPGLHHERLSDHRRNHQPDELREVGQ